MTFKSNKIRIILLDLNEKVYYFTKSRKKEVHNRKRCGCVLQPSENDVPGSGLAITLGTVMDAVPEGIVLGLSLFTQGVNLPLILAIALGNLPEAISGSVGMLVASRTKV
jgi:ZIP family zinc transporter